MAHYHVDELSLERLCIGDSPKPYTCMLSACAHDGETYSLQLIYDTEEHLFLRDGKHLYIWATPGSYEPTDIQFFTAMRIHFSRHNANDDMQCKPLRIVQMQPSSLTPKNYNGLLSSTFFTNVIMHFEYLFEGKSHQQIMLFHRYDYNTIKTRLCGSIISNL